MAPEELDLVIVGAGAAGLAAALYAARARLASVTVERMGAGGQLINVDRIDDYPGFPDGIAGYDLGPRLAEQAMTAGARIEYGEITAIVPDHGAWRLRGDGLDYRANAVIIAAGSTLARLGVPGEEDFAGRGVSSCATCDGEFFRDQEVAVVGGGDSALDEAEFLSGICAGITIIHRDAELAAAAVLRECARANPKLRFLGETVVEAIRGNGSVEALDLRNLTTGESTNLPVSGVFIYVGLKPNSGFLSELLPLDAAGHIPTDIWMATAQPGIFAAGDIRQHSARQLGSCIGDGITAAIAAERYIRGGG